MIAIRNNTARLLAVAALGASLTMFSASAAFAAPAAPAEARQDSAKQRQEWMKQRLDKLADRLEIKASQQSAWQAYVKTLESIGEHPARKPEMKTDAASIARRHAEMAAAMAQKLAQIADATANLQEVLSPDQRKTLDQVVAHAGHHHGHFFHHGERDEHREHGEHGDGHWGHYDHGSEDGKDHDQQH
jgi:cell wall-associated NlpC family hydrolase